MKRLGNAAIDGVGTFHRAMGEFGEEILRQGSEQFAALRRICSPRLRHREEQEAFDAIHDAIRRIMGLPREPPRGSLSRAHPPSGKPSDRALTRSEP